MALKKTSEIVAISDKLDIGSTDPTRASTKQISLQLSPLDLEVFVVTAVDIQYKYDMQGDLSAAGSGGVVEVSVSTTAREAIGRIDESNVITTGVLRVGSDNASSAQSTSIDSPVGHDLDYIAIIATNDYFLQGFWTGFDSPNETDAYVRVYGYRAKADAATYAALVQSEQLSA